MGIKYQHNCDNIDWDQVKDLLTRVGMSSTDPEIHRVSFDASREVIFAFDGDKMIGFGRAISDGVRQAALYDIAVDNLYQGKGIGKEIVLRIMQKLPDCNFILYASPNKESFYKKLNFKKMKTGMVYFQDVQRMIDGGFVEE